MRKGVVTSTSTEIAVNHRAANQNEGSVYEHDPASSFYLCIEIKKTGTVSKNLDLRVSFSHHDSR